MLEDAVKQKENPLDNALGQKAPEHKAIVLEAAVKQQGISLGNLIG